MNNSENKSAPATEAAADPKHLARFVIRLSVVLVVVLLTALVVAVAVPWGRYRIRHVVLSEATVKGTVTKIGARLDGRIKNIEVEVGQCVRKGDVILRMEDRHLQAAVDRARSELQCALKDLESEKLGVAQTRRRLNIEIERSDAARRKAAGELEADKSTLAKWQKQYERIAALIKIGAEASNSLDKIIGERDKAQGMFNAGQAVAEAAESNYQKAQNELEGVQVRESRLAVLESQIDVARAKLTAAEADIEAAVIKAPEDGRVLERIVEVGGSAKVGETLMSLWVGRAWVEAWADERDLRKIRIGSPVDISLDASPDRRLVGRVEAFGLMTDKERQTTPVPSTLRSFVRQNAMVPVRIAFEEDNSRLQLGLSVLVGIKKDYEGASLAAEAHPGRNSVQGLTKVTAKE